MPVLRGFGVHRKAYLDDAFSNWIVRCGLRYFKAETGNHADLAAVPRLMSGGGCSSGIADSAVEASEVLLAELPFLPEGVVLHLVPASEAPPTILPVSAVSPSGLALLALLVVAAGAFLLRKG